MHWTPCLPFNKMPSMDPFNQARTLVHTPLVKGPLNYEREGRVEYIIEYVRAVKQARQNPRTNLCRSVYSFVSRQSSILPNDVAPFASPIFFFSTPAATS